MTNKIDFGFGWDPTEQFDLPAIENQTVKEVEQSAFTQAQSKAAYLEMQQAIQNHNADLLKTLIGQHKEYLTPSRWKTLGRLAVKNFSQEVVNILNQTVWNDVLSTDLLLWCVTNDKEQAFDFAKKMLLKSSGDDFAATDIKTLYSCLMAVTPNNYLMYDKYRSKLVDALSAKDVDSLAGQLEQNLVSVTPKTYPAYQNVFKELATANWENVFSSQNPYRNWRSQESAFGLTMLLRQYPDIATQLSQWQKLQRLKEKRLELIALNSVFKIGLHEPITTSMRAVDVFSKDFLNHMQQSSQSPENHMRARNLYVFTPYMLLNHNDHTCRMFQSQFEKFCKEKQLPWCKKLRTGVEEILRFDDVFIKKLIGTIQGKDILNQHLKKGENAFVFAECLVRMDKKDTLALLPHLEFTPNNMGWTFAHHLAIELARTDNYRAPDITYFVKSENIDWNATNTSGETAKDFLLTRVFNDVRQQCIDLFKEREAKLLDTAAKASRKNNNLRTKSTKRKM